MLAIHSYPSFPLPSAFPSPCACHQPLTPQLPLPLQTSSRSASSIHHSLTNSPQLPFWALVSFGAYLLFNLGWGVFTFNDVSHAHAVLIKEIDMPSDLLRHSFVEVD